MLPPPQAKDEEASVGGSKENNKKHVFWCLYENKMWNEYEGKEDERTVHNM